MSSAAPHQPHQIFPRHFLKDTDLSPQQQAQVLALARVLKEERFEHVPLSHGPSRESVAVLFDKTSTRTRFSFAAGIAELGGNPIIVDSGQSQIGAKESVEDTARVLERQVSAIVWRTFAQSGLEAMAAHSRRPVINALSDDYHPCQILADLLTLTEHVGSLAGRTLTYIGDGANNMAHSYLLGGATAGMHVRIATPADALPAAAVLAEAQQVAEQTGGSVSVTQDALAASAGADAIVTDTWISMGHEAEKAERLTRFEGFRVTQEHMAAAGEKSVFLHCLPAYRGVEVDAEVIDGLQSLIWDEAENRLHAQKALLFFLIDPEGAAALL